MATTKNNDVNQPKGAVNTVVYKTMRPEDRLPIAIDFLRSRELEHYRTWLATPASDESGANRLAPIAAHIGQLQEEVTKLEAETGVEP